MGGGTWIPEQVERPSLSSQTPGTRCSKQVSITPTEYTPTAWGAQMRPPPSLTHERSHSGYSCSFRQITVTFLGPIVGVPWSPTATSSQRKHSGVLTEPSGGGLSSQPSARPASADRLQHGPPASTFLFTSLLEEFCMSASHDPNPCSSLAEI